MSNAHMTQNLPAKWVAAAAAALLCGLAAPSGASADVLVDTFDVGGGFHPDYYSVAATGRDMPPFGFDAMRSAVRFSVSGGDATLTSVTLPVSFQGVGTNLRVRITSDAGDMPGTTLEVLSENASIWPVGASPFTTTTTVTSTTHPTLTDGASYWLVLELTSMPTAPASSGYNWSVNHSGVTTEFRQQRSMGSLPTDPWSGSVGPQAVAFRVEGSRLLLNGTVCTTDESCGSGNCADGVCCDTACGGSVVDCMACSAAAGGVVDGTCGALSAAAAPGVECRASAGACDLVETCDAASVMCPVDASAADGTSCADADLCNGGELCSAGACAAAGALDCDDLDACTADACEASTGCSHAPIAGCGVDAGAGSDAGVAPPPADGGCSCRAAGRSGRDGALSSIFLVALGLAFATRRRR